MIKEDIMKIKIHLKSNGKSNMTKGKSCERVKDGGGEETGKTGDEGKGENYVLTVVSS